MYLLSLIAIWAVALGAACPLFGKEVLRTCAEVHALSPTEAAAGHEVRLSGVITFSENPDRLPFIIQDETGGCFIRTGSIEFPRSPGNRIEITGVTEAGGFAPVVRLQSHRITGDGPLPEAIAVPYEDLRMGYVDGLRIKYRSRVRAVSTGSRQRPFNPPRLIMELGDQQKGSVEIHMISWEGIDPDSLLNAEVEVKGVASGHFNDRRQIMRPRILVQSGDDLKITEEALTQELVPEVAIRDLFTYKTQSTRETRVRFSGVVVAVNAPDWIAVQDMESGILLQPAPLAGVEIGDRVRVLGYPVQNNLQPTIFGARVEKLGRGEIPPARKMEDLAGAAGLQGSRVVVEGTLMEPPALIAGLARLRLATETGNLSVEVPAPGEVPAVWQTGARLSATGVCLAEYSPEAMSRRFPNADRVTVQAPYASSVVLLASAPWWTPQRLGFVLGGLLLVLALAALALGFLGSKTRKLSVTGRALARAELLRTTQLHENLATAHEQQLTFQAVLRERQRLAQELHDSMEQQFASLSLHAEAALAGGATDAGPGLRRFIEDSRTEVRRCVWGLRARALDRRGIGAALQELARQHNAGAGPRLVVSESGQIRALDPASENHLFRFAQEAVGNALKHAAAKTILLSLEWGNEMLGLAIKDDGRGLPSDSPTPASLEARAAALSARMTASTNEPSGTRVALEMDLAPHLSTHPPEA